MPHHQHGPPRRQSRYLHSLRALAAWRPRRSRSMASGSASRNPVYSHLAAAVRRLHLSLLIRRQALHLAVWQCGRMESERRIHKQGWRATGLEGRVCFGGAVTGNMLVVAIQNRPAVASSGPSMALAGGSCGKAKPFPGSGRSLSPVPERLTCSPFVTATPASPTTPSRMLHARDRRACPRVIRRVHYLAAGCRPARRRQESGELSGQLLRPPRFAQSRIIRFGHAITRLVDRRRLDLDHRRNRGHERPEPSARSSSPPHSLRYLAVSRYLQLRVEFLIGHRLVASPHRRLGRLRPARSTAPATTLEHGRHRPGRHGAARRLGGGPRWPWSDRGPLAIVGNRPNRDLSRSRLRRRSHRTFGAHHRHRRKRAQTGRCRQLGRFHYSPAIPGALGHVRKIPVSIELPHVYDQNTPVPQNSGLRTHDSGSISGFAYAPW